MKVTMGMPVYNGEPFIEAAIQSLLHQTYDDFELVISDNASTDRTGGICQEYAATDPRIRYTRNETNLGLIRNQNRVYGLARGEYFLLTHHDDIRSPEYLKRTLDILDNDESIVVCYSKTRDIDARGNHLPRQDPPLRFDSPDLWARFRDVIRMDHICEPVFGLMRMTTLRMTRLHGDYADSDRVLLTELLFHGRFHRVPEYLFFRRAHSGQSTAVAPDRQSRTAWLNADMKGKLTFPHFREFVEYLAAIRRASIPSKEKARCLAEMARWIGVNRRRLAGDLDYAVRHTLRPLYHAIRPGAR